jgi:hypothetical protein
VRSEWRDHAHERLRLLLPGQWMLAGELFDEVRIDIPLHIAMRQAMRQRQRTGVPPAPAIAQWMLFAHGLRTMGCIDREPCGLTTGSGRKNDWRYPDRIRLQPVADMACETCGGPMIALRNVPGRVRDAKRFACQICENPSLVRLIEERLNVPESDSAPDCAPIEDAPSAPSGQPTETVPAPVEWTKAAEVDNEFCPSLDPALRPSPIHTLAVKMSPFLAVLPLASRTPDPLPHLNFPPRIPRRAVARMIRELVPNKDMVSINRIERELEASHDDAEKVLAIHGIVGHRQFMDRTNRKKLLGLILGASSRRSA